jgi:uncharacterized repeat protein (TIGR01451 family)
MKTSQRARSAAALTAGLLALPALLGASHPAPPHGTATAWPPRAAELAVTVSDGHVAVRPGDVLTYLVTVRDTGTVAAPHLTITQTMSQGLRFLSASEHGAGASGRVSWSAGLAAGGSRTFRVTARVTKTPSALLRLAAVACVTLPRSRTPAVCASHLDRLPAAATAAARPGGAGFGAAGFAAIGLGAAVLGLVIAIVMRRRGRVRRQPA